MLTHCAFYHHHSIAGHGLASLHEAFACDDLVFDAYKLRPAILSAIKSIDVALQAAESMASGEDKDTFLECEHKWSWTLEFANANAWRIAARDSLKGIKQGV